LDVTVVGQGYVGLVTAAGAAEWGHTVVGVEKDPTRRDSLLEGRVPFHEPMLGELVAANLANGRLRFTADMASGVAGADLVFIAVGTVDADGRWETRTMATCLAEVVPLVDDGATIVVRSTCPPAFVTTLAASVEAIRSEARRGPVSVMLNPEFTKEGTAVQDYLTPDRVVIGIARDPDGSGAAKLREFYGQVEAPIVEMSAIDAIMAKLGSNLFLATKISFANELAALCDLYGAQVEHVVEGMAHDPRIGGSFLRAGIGFGGSCLPHQVTMTVAESASRGHDASLFAAVDLVNHRQRTAFADHVHDLVGGVGGRRVALLGLTFKPHTDDLRAAPALDIAKDLIDRGATVVAYDPMETARTRAATFVPGLVVVESAEDALRDADVVALTTEWPEFVTLSWTRVAELVKGAIVVDGRNALDPDAVEAAGFVYRGFGRGQRGVSEPVRVPVMAADLPVASDAIAGEAPALRPVAMTHDGAHADSGNGVLR
jgi:UDPglucose 6-dehydrogenase